MTSQSSQVNGSVATEARPSEVADWRKQGEGVLLYKHPARERESAPVRCGVAVQCSALWERVEVQWCCHGDKLPDNQSWK